MSLPANNKCVVSFEKFIEENPRKEVQEINKLGEWLASPLIIQGW
jgi:hypothetical protein